MVALLSIQLPETRGRKLLENVNDADHEGDLEIDG